MCDFDCLTALYSLVAAEPSCELRSGTEVFEGASKLQDIEFVTTFVHNFIDDPLYKVLLETRLASQKLTTVKQKFEVSPDDFQSDLMKAVQHCKACAVESVSPKPETWEHELLKQFEQLIADAQTSLNEYLQAAYAQSLLSLRDRATSLKDSAIMKWKKEAAEDWSLEQWLEHGRKCKQDDKAVYQSCLDNLTRALELKAEKTVKSGEDDDELLAHAKAVLSQVYLSITEHAICLALIVPDKLAKKGQISQIFRLFSKNSKLIKASASQMVPAIYGAAQEVLRA